MDTQDIEILLEGEVADTMLNPLPDMWHLDGEWRSTGNKAFEVELGRQSLQRNFTQQTGISVTYRSPNELSPALIDEHAYANMLLRRLPTLPLVS